MGIDDLVNQGKELLDQNRDAIDGVLRSEQAEDISDKVLDGGADLAKRVLPDNLDGQVDGLRDQADKAVGNE